MEKKTSNPNFHHVFLMDLPYGLPIPMNGQVTGVAPNGTRRFWWPLWPRAQRRESSWRTSGATRRSCPGNCWRKATKAAGTGLTRLNCGFY